MPSFFKKQLLLRTLKAPYFSSFQLALWQGDLSGIPFWLLQKYKERGLLQVLALSGQHVWALALCLGFFGSFGWKFCSRSRGTLVIVIRKLKVPLATGVLLSLAPKESSMIRTGLCVGLICLFREIPLLMHKGYSIGLGIMIFLMGYPDLIFEKGFQLSLVGILGVWIVGGCFTSKQKGLAALWLGLWLMPVVALFFGKWVGDSFFLQVGMGFIWEQVFLPILFLSGVVLWMVPPVVSELVAEGCETILSIWLNWEAIHTEKSSFSVYRPSELESLLFLAWLVALAYWNRKRCQNVPKKNAYGATCIDLTRGASRQ